MTEKTKRFEPRTDTVDLLLTLKNGKTVELKGIRGNVFEAFQKMKRDGFDRNFLWNDECGVAVDEVAVWEITAFHDDLEYDE